MTSPYNISQQEELRNHTGDELYQKVLQFWLIYRGVATPLYRVLVVTLFGTGILANTILLLYLFKSGKFRVPVFTLLTSLAVCDWMTCFNSLLAGIVLYPQIAVPEAWAFITSIDVYLTTTSYNASLCHLVFLAVLRYYQLVHPFSARTTVTTSWVFRWCLFMWAACAIISIPFPMYYIIFPITYQSERLIVFYFIGSSRLKEISVIVFCHILPTCIIVIFHLLKQFKVSKDSEATQQERRSTSHKTVSAIIALFILSILPRFVHGTYHEFLGFPYQSYHLVLFMCTALTGYSNSVLNPFLYLLSSQEIRKDILHVIFSKRVK